MRNLILEGKKLAAPVLVTTSILTLLTSILSCTLYQRYALRFELDAWEIGTEFLSLLFPLFVTVPICWQLYYERRDRFLVVFNFVSFVLCIRAVYPVCQRTGDVLGAP